LLRAGTLLKEHGVSDPRYTGAEKGPRSPGPESESDWDVRLPWTGPSPDRIRILDRTGRVWLDSTMTVSR
jgi:hypothetical protein